MAKYRINGNVLKSIADAIRSKTGDTATITPLQYAEEIASIENAGVSFRIVPYADNVHTGYIDGNIWKIGTGYSADVYAVTAGEQYLLSLGATAGARFQVLYTAANPTEASGDIAGTLLANVTTPAAYQAVHFVAPGTGYVTVLKDTSDASDIETYAYNVVDIVETPEAPTAGEILGVVLSDDVAVPGNVLDITGVKSIRTYAFHNLQKHKDGNTYDFSLYAPDVESVGSYAFDGCYVKEISFEKLQRLNISAFQSSHLKTLPDLCSVTDIPQYCFMTTSLSGAVEIPSPIATIGNGAFSGCSQITSVTFPASLRSAGNNCFMGCDRLTQATFRGTPTSLLDTVFRNCTHITDIYVPWSEGAVAYAPWGATNATIHYDTV